MKHNFKSIITTISILTLIQGCSTAKLITKGAIIEVIIALDRKDCKNLGPVFGKGGRVFGGTWISIDESLMEYASNDLKRNKAALKGATHVVVQGHQVGMTTGRNGGSTSTVTQQGITINVLIKFLKSRSLLIKLTILISFVYNILLKTIQNFYYSYILDKQNCYFVTA